MAKPRDDEPINASDLLEYLKSQDSLDLELFVYRAAREAGLQASHGGSYEDPITRKARQYDIRAAREEGTRRIDLAIECKGLKPSYPLLVSRIPRSTEESFHDIVHSRVGRRVSFVSPGLDDAKIRRETRRRSMYPVGDPVGKSLSQVGRNKGNGFRADDREV